MGDERLLIAAVLLATNGDSGLADRDGAQAFSRTYILMTHDCSVTTQFQTSVQIYTFGMYVYVRKVVPASKPLTLKRLDRGVICT